MKEIKKNERKKERNNVMKKEGNTERQKKW